MYIIEFKCHFAEINFACSTKFCLNVENYMFENVLYGCRLFVSFYDCKQQYHITFLTRTAVHNRNEKFHENITWIICLFSRGLISSYCIHISSRMIYNIVSLINQQKSGVSMSNIFDIEEN